MHRPALTATVMLLLAMGTMTAAADDLVPPDARFERRSANSGPFPERVQSPIPPLVVHEPQRPRFCLEQADQLRRSTAEPCGSCRWSYSSSEPSA